MPEIPRLLVAAAILASAALMMAVTGYSFMAGNHEVYLLEPLRRAGLASFEGDWFVTQTLQYHGLYATISAWLLSLDVARSAFLVIFLILLLTTAWAWWRIVRALGGDVTAYLVSVVAYHFLLGDRALGFYSLLQDGQFNAGNVAAVGLLVGIAMWIEGRVLWAGLAFGLAGAFHLNHAVVAPGLWVALVAWQRFGRARLLPSRSGWLMPWRQRLGGSHALPTLLALLPSLVNIGFALPSKLAEREAMPLGRFVDLYVHLRHPHHYDPLAWPWWVWGAFLLPVPFAIYAWRRFSTPHPPGEVPSEAQRSRGGEGRDDCPQHGPAPSPGPSATPPHPLPEGEGVRAGWNEAGKIWLLLMGLQVFALLTAGVFWVTETFVQLSLWRFSPHAKVLAVCAAAVWMVGRRVNPGLRSAQPSASKTDTEHGLAFGRRRGTGKSQRLAWIALAIIAVGAMGIGIERMRHAAGADVLQELSGPIHLWLAGLSILAAAALLFIHDFARLRPKRRGRPDHWQRKIRPLMRRGLVYGSSVLCCLIILMPIHILGGSALPPPGQNLPDDGVMEAAAWARTETRPDALFLLPPDASAFSINARRGQVVSFKLVPQLSGELIEWDQRLRDVLDVPDLSIYGSGFTGYRDVQRRMRQRYDALPSAHLFDVAQRYGARYVFRSREDETVDENEATVAWRGEDGAVIYALRE